MPGPMFSLWSGKKEEKSSIPTPLVTATFPFIINDNYIDSLLDNKIIMDKEQRIAAQKATLFNHNTESTKSFTIIKTDDGTHSNDIIGMVNQKEEFDPRLTRSDDVTGRITSFLPVKFVDDYNNPANSSIRFGEESDKTIIINSIKLNQDNIINNIDIAYDPEEVDPLLKAMEKNSGFPVKNRKQENFEILQSDKPIDKCSHDIQIATKLTGKGGKKYVHKKMDADMAFLEAISNAFLRWLVPDVVSSSNAVHNGQQYTAVVSRIKNFVSFRQQFYATLPTDEKIKKLAQMLVGSYLFKEDDLHRGNIGEDERVDCDMLFWPILHKKKGNRGQDCIPYLKRDLKTAFKITAEDIRNFPDIGNNYCHYWVTKTGWFGDNHFTSEQNDFFKALKSNPVFIREKFRIMLKFLLIANAESSKALCRLHAKEDASIDDDKVINLFKTEIEERREELKDVLVGMPEFYEFMTEHGASVLNEIITEVSKANDKVAHKKANGKPGYEQLHADINKLQNDYARIKEEIFTKQVYGFDVDMTSNKVTHYIL